MIYLDANVFIYAYWKPRREDLSPKTKWVKEKSKEIIRKLNDGYQGTIEYCISLVQLVEVVNILKYAMSWTQLKEFLWGLFSNQSIEILDVSQFLYLNAIDKITEFEMDPNDISAYLIMKEKNITVIYTFDENFRKRIDINCLPEMPDLT